MHPSSRLTLLRAQVGSEGLLGDGEREEGLALTWGVTDLSGCLEDLDRTFSIRFQITCVSIRFVDRVFSYYYSIDRLSYIRLHNAIKKYHGLLRCGL